MQASSSDPIARPPHRIPSSRRSERPEAQPNQALVAKSDAVRLVGSSIAADEEPAILRPLLLAIAPAPLLQTIDGYAFKEAWLEAWFIEAKRSA